MSTPSTVFKQYEQEAYASYETISGIALDKNADGTFKPQGLNDALDAYRHAYVSAVMTRDYNKFVAHVAGTVHEVRGELFGNPVAGERNMDLWNNSKGRDIGSNTPSRAAIAQNVYDALQNGELITTPD
jgi:hypothetical protein